MKKTSRRSVSISGELYEALQNYSDLHGLGQSQVVEDTLRILLGMAPRPDGLVSTKRAATMIRKREQKRRAKEAQDQHDKMPFDPKMNWANTIETDTPERAPSNTLFL